MSLNDGFRPVSDFFTRDKAQQLIEGLADFQRRYGLPPHLVEQNISRVTQVLNVAGELSRRESLPDGDKIVLYLGVIYASYVPAVVEPVFHTVLNAEQAWQGASRLGYSRYAAIRVVRAIKEYPHRDELLTNRFIFGFGKLIAGAKPGKVEEVIERVMREVLERPQKDIEVVCGGVAPHHRWGGETVSGILRRDFGDVLVYPAPSTSERWEYNGDFVREPGLARMRLYSVGSPGGRDWDFALVNVPGLSKCRIVLGPLELFINDTNAASAIDARQTMDLIYRRRPKLYRQWQHDKGMAAEMLDRGEISREQYVTFKALWHRSRGLPWMHYGWKQSGTINDLPPGLVELIPAREGGYNQIPLLLHDCLVNPLPTRESLWFYLKYKHPDEENVLIGYWLEDLLDRFRGALSRLHCPSARDLLGETTESLQAFQRTTSLQPGLRIEDAGALFEEWLKENR